MKHRSLLGLLLVVASVLAACTPAEGGEGAEESTPAPADFSPAPADFYRDY